MDTTKPATKDQGKVINLRFPDELIEAIDKWRFDNHIYTRKQAMEILLRAGLEAKR